MGARSALGVKELICDLVDVGQASGCGRRPNADIRACWHLDRIEAWQPETIVPGHGPITDLAGVREIRAYYEHCHAEARRCFDAEMDLATAAADVSFDRWADWGEPERIVTLLDTCYREFEGRSEATPMAELFALMAERWAATRT